MFDSIIKGMRRLATIALVGFVVLGLLLSMPFVRRWIYPLRYREIILKEARAANLDPNLVAAVINVESRWRENAISCKGARGLMQLMPTTAQWIAGKLDLGSLADEELLLPEINIRLGIWYLAHLYEQFDRNWTVALAAYNGGRGNVKTWLTEGVWDGTADMVHSIPFAETRKYVTKVEAQYRIYRDLYDWPGAGYK